MAAKAAIHATIVRNADGKGAIDQLFLSASRALKLAWMAAYAAMTVCGGDPLAPITAQKEKRAAWGGGHSSHTL